MSLKKYKSSQTGKNGKSKNKKHKLSFYPHMFIQDYCLDFSISFSGFNSHDDFYKANTIILSKLLEEENHLFFKYDLSELLSGIMHDLIFYGQSSVEIVLYFNDSNEVIGISFFPLNYVMKIPFLRRKHFFAKSFNEGLIYYYVEKKRLTEFNIRELGITKKFFNKILKKLSKLGISDISLGNRTPNIDYEFYKRDEEYKLLNFTKGVYWDGRNSNNQFVNEPYYLYRLTKYNILRLRILKYLLSKINTSLIRIGKEYSFQGEIECKLEIDEKISFLKTSYEKYEKKEINQDQLLEILQFRD